MVLVHAVGLTAIPLKVLANVEVVLVALGPTALKLRLASEKLILNRLVFIKTSFYIY